MLGTVLAGRYKIIKNLGGGGFGQTYLAEDSQKPVPNRCVVKQFKPVNQDEKSLEIARRLFHTEVAVQERLGQHDQIPTFIDFFEEDQEFYLVQEFIDGHSLSDELARRRFSEPEVMAMLKDVLKILEFVHQNRVIHRDIKPGNLIRRYPDGRIVLIDFGAVKEIHTQLAGGTGETSFTVGIGTQGYTPTEQLAGKPRFCSDLYALGMTAIQALTGLSPSALPEDPDTAEFIWQDRARVSLGLAFVLDRMVRFHYKQRYQSATEVLQALQRLEDLPTNITDIPPSMLLPESLRGTETQLPFFDRNWRERLKRGIGVVAIATVVVTGFIAGIRQLGWLEPLELDVYDRMVQLRPELPPDPRLLMVEITEADLQQLNRPTPSDQDVAQVVANLLEHQPTAVGLDLYRDLPQEPGQEALLEQLQNPRTIAIMNLGGENTARIPPPPGVPPERVGFNDFPVDSDGVVRRNLMFASLDNESYTSFSLRLALQYLAQQGVAPQPSDQQPAYMQVNDVVFPFLKPNSGGYQGADTAGYQIMLDYRSAEHLAQTVSFTDVLNGNFDPSWVTDRVVLIGTTAPSGKDLFDTPYTLGQRKDYQMAGVTVHGQMVSQLLSAVLDGRSLIWFWPEWGELLWIALWAATGSAVAWFIHHPLRLSMVIIVAIGALSATTWILFTQNAWIPIVAPGMALIMAGGATVAYRAYLIQTQQHSLNRLWWKDHASQEDGNR
jgi:CHASE2 domain-containing sensor protein